MLVNVKQNSRFNEFTLGNFIFYAIIFKNGVNVIAYINSDFSVVFIILV